MAWRGKNLILYLRVPPSQAQKLVAKKTERKYTAAKHDILEKDLRHLEDAAEMYDMLSRSRPWATIQWLRFRQQRSADAGRYCERMFAGGETPAGELEKGLNNGLLRISGQRADGCRPARRIAGGARAHAMLFTGPRGVGKFTLARMFAQAANCERLKDDFCGDCTTCQRIGLLANLDDFVAQGWRSAERARTRRPWNAYR